MAASRGSIEAAPRTEQAPKGVLGKHKGATERAQARAKTKKPILGLYASVLIAQRALQFIQESCSQV